MTESFQQAAIRDIATAFNVAPPSNLERALALANLGLTVFPCRPDKAPLTPRGFKDASCDPDVICRWWSMWPDALVGLPTGRENGIAVADLDLKDNKDWRQSAVKAGLILPATHTITTRSGGEHRYYRYPQGVEKIQSTSDLFKHLVGSKKTGIDVRGDHAYVIAWSDLNEQILGDLAEWPTAVFEDAKRRDEEAGKPPPAPAPQAPREREAPQESARPDDLERAQAALEFVPADDRDDWIKIGMALKVEFGEAGRHAWDKWSATSSKFNAKDQEHKWQSFNGSGVTDIKLGTLFKLAKDHGWRPPASPSVNFTLSSPTKTTDKPPPSKFKLIRFRDIKPVLSGLWIIKDILPARGLCTVYGEPGCGKSFLTLDMALHVAAGLPYLGKRVRQSRVVYIAAEGQGGFRNRVAAARQALELNDDLQFDLIEMAPNLGVKNGDAKDLIQSIEAQREPGDLPLGGIVVDTIAQSMGGENENLEGMATFIVNVNAIASHFACLGLAVHHVGKSDTDRPRGWSGLHGANDTEIKVTGTSGTRTAEIAKQKDGDIGDTFQFNLRSIDVGIDEEDGKPIKSCTVEQVGELGRVAKAEAKAAKKRPAKYRAQFEQAFNEAILNNRVMRSLTGPANVLTPSVACVDREHVRTEFYKRCSEERPDTKQRAFVRVLEALFQEYPQEQDEDGKEWIWKVKP